MKNNKSELIQLLKEDYLKENLKKEVINHNEEEYNLSSSLCQLLKEDYLEENLKKEVINHNDFYQKKILNFY